MKFENEKLMTLLLIYYHIDSPNRYNARYLNFALLNYIKKKSHVSVSGSTTVLRNNQTILFVGYRKLYL